jgi:hypothetical protein
VPTLKAKAKKAKSAKSAKAKKPASPSVTLLGLHARLSALEEHVSRSGSRGIEEAPPTDLRPLTFTLHVANAPRITQLTLQDTGEEIVLTPNSPSKSSKPRASGISIDIGIDTFGDPGQNATLDVTNVKPHGTPIVTSVLTGSSASDATTIETSW